MLVALVAIATSCAPATPAPEEPVVWNVVEQAPPQRASEASTSSTAFFCHAAQGLGRVCFDTPQACVLSSTRHEGSCGVFATAHCMSYRRTIDNKDVRRCFTDARVCRDFSLETMASADYEGVSECWVVTAGPAAVDLAKADLADLAMNRTGWWCSVSGMDRVTSICSRSRPQCERQRAQMAGAYADCAEQKRAACFSYWSTLDQETRVECRSTFADCQAFRTVTTGRADDAEKVGACAATE